MSEVSDAERLRLREPPPASPVMRQVWRQLAFLHWRVERAAVAALLPPGLEVDCFDGAAYVGVVPFTIPLTRKPRLALPLAPAFHEINARTYVHRAGRDPGVWFFSLDATSRLAVAGARIGYRLPYFAAEIALEEADGWIDYRSRRRRGPAEFRARYQPVGPVAPAAPGSLEFFLAERYLLYARWGRRLRTARVHHAPYPLQAAAAEDVTQTLTEAAGLPPGACAGPPPLAHYAAGVDVRIFGPSLSTP
ncbi:MAG TPA: DUF2071 domain-containing protein [Polyangia bacterium]